MNELTRSRIRLIAIWCAVVYIALLFLGWGGVAGYLPPTSPSRTADQIARLYATDHQQIRIGMLVVMLAALAFIPFAAVVAHYIARVEGGPGVLTWCFLLGGAGNMCLTFYPAIWWLVAAFRPERSAELTLLLNDAAWLQFLGGVTIYLAMPITVGITALVDASERPAFPRWAGWANLFVAVAIVPDQLMFFFRSGPFAWNGLFGIWLPVAWFCGFFAINFVVLRNTILRDRAELGRLSRGHLFDSPA